MNNDANTAGFYQKELRKWQAIAAERLERIVKLRNYISRAVPHYPEGSICQACQILEETKEDA